LCRWLTFGFAAAFMAMGTSTDVRADYAFCSVTGTSTRCDFQTYEQCQATVSGVGADCIANPSGPPPAPTAPAMRHRRR
jgi:Protein of unknown function (DUF3551)